MYDYLIHADNGLDGPVLIGGADTIEEARTLIKQEMKRDPQRFYTIVDRWGGEHDTEVSGG